MEPTQTAHIHTHGVEDHVLAADAERQLADKLHLQRQWRGEAPDSAKSPLKMETPPPPTTTPFVLTHPHQPQKCRQTNTPPLPITSAYLACLGDLQPSLARHQRHDRVSRAQAARPRPDTTRAARMAVRTNHNAPRLQSTRYGETV